jgi:ribosomal protein L32
MKNPIIRKCFNCGQEFSPKTVECVLCPDCAERAKKDSVLKNRICKRCGAEFKGYPHSFYCPPCQTEVRREQKSVYNKRYKLGITRKIGSIDHCEVCGREYIVNSSNQRYCAECADEATKAAISKHKAERWKEQPELNEKRKPRRKRDHITVCDVCGKSFVAHTASPYCSEFCRAVGKKYKRAVWHYKRGDTEIEPTIEYFIEKEKEKENNK